MSVVVGLVKDGHVYMAADTRGLIGHEKMTVQKLFVSEHKQWGKWAMGSVGHMRNAEIANELDLPTVTKNALKTTTPQMAVRSYLDSLRDEIMSRGIVEDGNSAGNDYLIAVQGHLFASYEFYMQEAQVVAIGEGSPYVEGVLWTLQKFCPYMDPADMVRTAVEATEAFNVGIGGDIDVVVL